MERRWGTVWGADQGQEGVSIAAPLISFPTFPALIRILGSTWACTKKVQSQVDSFGTESPIGAAG